MKKNVNVIVRHVLIAFCLGAGAGSAAALTLGPARGQVVLGRPVDVSFEVLTDPGKTLEDSCLSAEVVSGERPLTRVRVLPLPALAGRPGMVRVLSAEAADEPVLGVTLSAGCTGRITRSYTFLVDPPAPGLLERAAAPALPASARPVASAAGSAAAGLPVQAGPVPGAAATSPRRAAAAPPRPEPAPPQARAERVARAKPKAARPQPAPAQPAPVARLVMEPLEDWLDDAAPVPLRLSTQMQPAADEAATPERRAQWQAQWKALNMDPQELLQEGARSAAQQQELALARGQAEQERRLAQDLQREVQERFPASVVYALGALALAALAAMGWLLWRMRLQADQARRDWHQAVAAQVPAGGTTAPAPLQPPAPAPDQEPVVAPPPAAAPAPIPVPEPEPLEPSDSLLVALGHAPQPPAAPAQPAALQAEPQPALLINPEELFDLQQQAEFFVSVGEHSQAIEVMKKYIAANATTAPAAYLDLLRLYRSLSRVDDFNQLRAQFHEHFNAQVPEFGAFNQPGRTLFAHPEALARIEAVWSDESVLPLLESLLFRRDAAAHARFELEAYDDLLLLYAIARTTPASARGAPPPRARTTPQAAAQAAGAAPAPAAPQSPEDGDFEDSLLEFDSAWLNDPPTGGAAPQAAPPAAQSVDSGMSIDFTMTDPGPLPGEPLPPLAPGDVPTVQPSTPPAPGQVVGFGANSDRFEARLDPSLRKP